MPEHTTETGFAPVRVTSEGPGAVGLCVLWVCDSGRAVSEPYYSQRVRSVRLSERFFHLYLLCHCY